MGGGGGGPADVSFSVTSPLNDTAFEVGIALIVSTTVLTFAAAVGLLALAARRSHRSVRILLIVAGVVAVVSATSPLSAADDTATGVLLATMHLVTGAAFLVTGRRAGA
ncbi:DUF6069 family protein [Phytoactinopolyspora halotolerans]|uniref:DUF6069 family protein n=1 Tax=Phytoactinopolyspora halotolerans TaxID=1981512 RepID=UPI0024845E84|nr:DUF6069 family protein [Phytoactinopolyspora halotolerans]